MNILIKSAKIIDPRNKDNGKQKDILILNGVIKEIKTNIDVSKIKAKYQLYKKPNLHISPGWFDMNVTFGEPGFEQRETLASGTSACIKGGYTGVQIMPNTEPKLDNKSQIDFILKSTKNSVLDILPSGNITKGGQGNEIVEMHDMSISGCKSFTDDKKSIHRNDVMKIAMLYSNDTKSLIMHYPNDPELSYGGMINEGGVSTELGLTGIPNIAEKIMTQRDVELCKYTGSRLHLSYLSCKESIEIVRKAKRKNNITCGVVVYNIFLNDSEVRNFDTRYKLLPPLRGKKDVNSIIKGLKDNTIDVITCNHMPCEEEIKKLEFDQAEFGIIGLEYSFGLIIKNVGKYLGLDSVIEKISINPRNILDIDKAEIKLGNKANITLFDPDKEWILKNSDIKSKSKNTPFLNQKLKGKPLAIYNNGKFEEC